MRKTILLVLSCIGGLIMIISSTNAYSQGSVYPLNSEVCQTATNYVLTWEGSGAIDKWQVNNGSGWSDIANTNSSVTFPTPTPGTYKYRTYINLGGGNFAYSNYSTVVVYASSAAGAGVSLTYNANGHCEGDNSGTIVLGAGAIGSLTNWVYSHTGSAPWNDVGESNTTLSYSNLEQTTWFKAKIKNGVCPAVLSTNTAAITVISAPDGGIASASPSEVCQNETTLLSVSGQNGTTITWQKNTGVWNDIAAGSTYTTPALTSGSHLYRVKASKTCVDATAGIVTVNNYSNEIAVTAYQTTASANPSGSTVVAYNDATPRNITVVPSNGSVVRWEKSFDNSQWIPLTHTSTTFTYSNLTQTTYYRVVTKNGTCTEAFSTTSVKITVAKGGVITSTGTNFCNPSTAATLTVSGHEGTTWAWESAVAPYTAWNIVASNVNTLAISNLTEDTKYRINMENGLAYSNPILISVSQPSVSGSLTALVSTVCPDDATNRTITLSGNTGNVVRWEYSLTNGAPWSTINNTTTTLTFNNLGQSTWYRAVVKNGACSEVNTASTKITVVTGGTVTSNLEVCEYDASLRSVSLAGHIGTVNRWEQSEYNTGTSSWGAWTNIGNAGNLSLSYSNLFRSTRYRAVITSACATDVTSDYATITVYPASVGGTISGEKTVRPADNTGSLVLGGYTGNIIRWESSPTGTAPWTSIANATATLNYSNITATTYYRAIVQNGPCASATSSNIAAIIVATKGAVQSNIAVCKDDATPRSLTIDGYVGTISTWQRSTDGANTWDNIAGTAGQVTYNYHSLAQTSSYRVALTVDGGTMYSDYATVTVNPLPAPAFAATTACLLGQTEFTNTSTIASGSIMYHEWTFGDGQGTNVTAPKHTYSTAGSYNVSLKLTSDKMCINTLTQTVSVLPLPNVDFSFNNVCDQEQVAFVNNSNLGGYTLTHAWNLGDGNTSNMTDPTHTYAADGNYNVTLTVTADGTCSKSLTKTVNIYENPLPNFTFTNVCNNNGMSFVNSSYISDGNLQYSWNFNDNGATSTLTNPQHTFTAPAIYNVTLTSTTPMGCNRSVSKAVQVYPVPVANFTVSNNCYGLHTDFTNASTIADGSMTYNWNFADGTSSVALNPSHQFAAAGSYLIRLTATSDFGCTHTIEKEALVHPVPTVNFSFNEACAGSSTNFINYSSLSNTTLTYAWNFGDAVTSTDFEPQHDYAAAGAYNVQLTATSGNNCSASITKSINVFPVPVANFTVNDVCEGTAMSFVNTSTISSGSITSNSWEFGNGGTSNLANPTYLYNEQGLKTITLTVTGNNGCKNVISKQALVNQKPTVSFTHNNVCIGSETNFTNQSTGLVSPTQYLWSIDGQNFASTGADTSYTYSSAGNKTVSLTVVNGNNCQASYSTVAVVNPYATPAFTVANACEGSSVQFYNTSSVNTGSIQYAWNMGDGTSLMVTDPVHIYPSSGTYTVTLTATTDKGCVSTTTQNLSIFEYPVVDFSASSLCITQTTQFTNLTASTDAVTYLWQLGDGQSTTTEHPAYTYSMSGTYYVNLTATTSHGCSANKTTLINIQPKPTVNFNTQNVCALAPTTFTNNSSGSGGSLTYQWNFGDNSAINSSFEPVYTYGTAGTYNVKLIATSAAGCTDSISKNIVIYPNPTASFAANTVCRTDTTFFTNSSSIASGQIASHQWNFGDGSTSVLQNPHHIYPNDGVYPVVLRVSSGFGCSHSDTIEVTVKRIPIPSFNQQNICANDTMVFNNTSTGLVGTPTYLWSFGDGIGASTLANPKYAYNSSGNYQVGLTITNGNGCSKSLTKTVDVYNVAAAAFSFDEPCENQQMQFLNQSQVTAGAISFSWDFGNSSTSSNTDPVTTYSSYGIYPVTLTATTDRGCVSTLTQTVNVHQNPIASFYTQNICYGFNSSFTNLSQLQSGSMTYNWNYGDQNSSQDQNPTHNYSSPGTYFVVLTATSSHGCVGSFTQNVKIYPVPAANFNVASICVNSNAVFDNISTIESGTMTYQWNFGNSAFSTEKNPTVVYNDAGNFDIQLIAVSNNQCSDTIVKTYEVYHSPVAAFVNDTVCFGLPTSFTNQSNIASGSITYVQWDFGDLTNSLQENPIHRYNDAGVYSVTLLVQSDKLCRNSITKQVIVDFVPVANFSVSPVCFGNASQFIDITYFPPSVPGNLTYNWSMGDGNTYVIKNPAHIYNTTGLHFAELVVTSSMGHCSDSITKQVLVYELPFVYAGRDTIANKGFPVMLNPIASNGDYIWTPSTGLDNPFIKNPIATPSENTSYVLVVTDQNGCVNSDTINVNVQADYELMDIYSSISNIITPDGNGENDTWYIKNISFYKGNHVHIFDRWGVEVFATTDYQNDWAGTNKHGDTLPDGTYYYVIYFDDSSVVVRGAITLLRYL